MEAHSTEMHIALNYSKKKKKENILYQVFIKCFKEPSWQVCSPSKGSHYTLVSGRYQKTIVYQNDILKGGEGILIAMLIFPPSENSILQFLKFLLMCPVTNFDSLLFTSKVARYQIH